MLQFIFTSILMISLGVILYLMLLSLPRIEEEPKEQKPNFLDRWAASELPEKIDMAINTFLFKMLRRMRVYLLKADNTIHASLLKLRPENGKTEAAGFKEIIESEPGKGGLERES